MRNRLTFSLATNKTSGSRPSNFASLHDLKGSLFRFQDYYQAAARPFEWKFTRRDLTALLERLAAHEPSLDQAA